MIGVFGSFILNGDPTVKQFGVGLAVAVALAASAVLVLTPAVLVLLRGGAWWLPRWLERALPYVDVEGEGVLREHGPRAPEAPAHPGGGSPPEPPPPDPPADPPVAAVP